MTFSMLLKSIDSKRHSEHSGLCRDSSSLVVVYFNVYKSKKNFLPYYLVNFATNFFFEIRFKLHYKNSGLRFIQAVLLNLL